MILFVTAAVPIGGIASLDEDEQHHLRVRRIAAGEEVSFTDGAGVRGQGRVAARGREFSLEIVAMEQVPPPVPLTLAVGAGDRDRFAWLVEKATELGVTRIVPLSTARTAGVSSGLKPTHLDKLRRRAEEALKQCGGAWVPVIGDIQSLDSFLQSSVDGELWVMDAAGEAPAAMNREAGVTALVGPEGGLDPEERRAVIEAGYVPVSAGPQVLRFETAALAAAVLAQQARNVRPS